MLAFQPGFYPLLLPEIEPAFQELATSGNWDVLEQARLAALARLRQTAAEVTHLVALHKNDAPEHLRDILTARFLTPLGL